MRREGQHKQQAPPELLEEVFELNESLDELREARPNGGASAEIPRKQPRFAASWRLRGGISKKGWAEVDGETASGCLSEWDQDPGGLAARLPRRGDARTSSTKALMERMNEMLNRRSYIRNLVASVQKELEED